VRARHIQYRKSRAQSVSHADLIYLSIRVMFTDEGADSRAISVTRINDLASKESAFRSPVHDLFNNALTIYLHPVGSEADRGRPRILSIERTFFFFFFFLTPFILQSRYQWLCEALLNLLCFSIQVCYCSLFLFWIVYGVGVCLAGKPRWFPRKVAVLRFCFTIIQHLGCPV